MKRVTLILAVLMTAPIAMGATLYVDGSLTSTPSGYFTSIIDAHAAAVENDTIDIYAGTYQMADLNNDLKHGITYQAHLSSHPTLLYEHVSIQNWANSNSIYHRGTDRLTFEGLIFVGKGQDCGVNDYGIYERSPYVDDITFYRCIFTECGKYAMYGYYGPGLNVTLDQCSFIKNAVGVRFSKSWTLKNDRITNCLFYDNQTWKPTEWDTVWVYAHWSGYAAKCDSGNNKTDSTMVLDYCVMSKSFGLNDGVVKSVDDDAEVGVGCLDDVTLLYKAPSFTTLNRHSEWFGYLTTANWPSLLGGGDCGQEIGARPVPEPATISLLMLGLLGLRRRRK